ncbi:MAG: hypothetical protein LBS27_11380, partial [Bifidobacteriaceae bacterium]|nr:hypothetical protein [Bifidobacteriaceae bacterium]
AAAAEVAAFMAAARAAAGGGGRALDLVEEAARKSARELGRVMVEGAANLVAAGAPAPGACGCGAPARVHSVRARTVSTMLGPVTVGRAYYYCRSCGASRVPADEALGTAGRTMSAQAERAVAAAGREMPFARASDMVAEISGARVASPSTTARTARRAGRRARALAAARAGRPPERRRWDDATTAYVLTDGLCPAGHKPSDVEWFGM